MAIANWSIPTENQITNTTKIKDADNKLQSNLDDLANWVNSTSGYTDTGLKQEVNTFLADAQSSLEAIVEDTIDTEW